MGEIKSTMDIIMERTKNLTMTEEEKRTLKERDMAGRVKGLIQRYLDGGMDLNRLRAEVEGLLAKDRDLAGRLVKEEALGRIEPGKNNELLLAMIEETMGMDVTPVREILADVERRWKKDSESHEKTMRETLREKGISGSAVLPNLDKSEEWRRSVEGMKREMKERLMSA